MFVIRLKHLPDEATSSDVRKFFKKIEIPDGGVHILGGPKGVVFITLRKSGDVEKALVRDGKKLSPQSSDRSSKVKVSKSSKHDMQLAIEEITNGHSDTRQSRREVTPPPPDDVYVRLSELSPDAGAREIMAFFDGINISLIKMLGGGRAYVQFQSVDDKQDALTFDQRFFGSRFVKVHHLSGDIWESCSATSIDPAFEKKRSAPREEMAESRKSAAGACVMISGIAQSATKRDIVHELLKDCKITNYGLYMETENGVCTGNCFVEFVDRTTRDKAVLRSHKSSFHGRTVALTEISHENMKNRVRQHRKAVKQSEFLRRQTEKEHERNVSRQRSPSPARDQSPDKLHDNEGLDAFYGDYSDNRFSQRTTEEGYGAKDKKEGTGKITMNLINSDKGESVLSRLAMEQKEKIEKQKKKESKDIMNANPMQLMMMQTMMNNMISMQTQNPINPYPSTIVPGQPGYTQPPQKKQRVDPYTTGQLDVPDMSGGASFGVQRFGASGASAHQPIPQAIVPPQHQIYRPEQPTPVPNGQNHFQPLPRPQHQRPKRGGDRGRGDGRGRGGDHGRGHGRPTPDHQQNFGPPRADHELPCSFGGHRPRMEFPVTRNPAMGSRSATPGQPPKYHDNTARGGHRGRAHHGSNFGGHDGGGGYRGRGGGHHRGGDNHRGGGRGSSYISGGRGDSHRGGARGGGRGSSYSGGDSHRGGGARGALHADGHRGGGRGFSHNRGDGHSRGFSGPPRGSFGHPRGPPSQGGFRGHSGPPRGNPRGSWPRH